MALTFKPQGVSTATGPSWLSASLYNSDALYWVDSVTGNDTTGTGEEWAPKATIFGASGGISLTTTSVANIIVCKSTHRETLGAAYTFSKNGITIVSLGSGTDRAQIQNAGYSIAVSGTEVRLENLYFPANSAAYASTTTRMTVTGTGFTMRDCQMNLGSNDVNDGVLVNGVAHTNFRGTTFKATGRPASGTTQIGLRITGASTDTLIEDCVFDGGTVGYTGAACKIDTATADRFLFRECTLQNYAVVAITPTGIDGTGTFTVDATSRVDWTE